MRVNWPDWPSWSTAVRKEVRWRTVVLAQQRRSQPKHNSGNRLSARGIKIVEWAQPQFWHSKRRKTWSLCYLGSSLSQSFAGHEFSPEELEGWMVYSLWSLSPLSRYCRSQCGYPWYDSVWNLEVSPGLLIIHASHAGVIVCTAGLSIAIGGAALISRFALGFLDISTLCCMLYGSTAPLRLLAELTCVSKMHLFDG